MCAMKIKVFDPSLVLLIGPSGCGKTTFARTHFKPTEIASSDHYRALISDDEGDQRVTHEAFELLQTVVAKRLAHGKLTVVDATNLKAEARRPLLFMARRYHLPVAAVIFAFASEVCKQRNRQRVERSVPEEIIERQSEELRVSLQEVRREGFERIYEIKDKDAAVEVERLPLPCDQRAERGPFDIIGDVHGCFQELVALLGRLGYGLKADSATLDIVRASSRRLIFLGDLVAQGPEPRRVVELVMTLVESGAALCLPGDCDAGFAEWLRDQQGSVMHSLRDTVEQFASEPPEVRHRVRSFIESLPSHYVLDGGRLVVAHAGLKETMQGRSSRQVRDFALYGETTGTVERWMDPARFDWVARYRGRALVVYGHAPTREPELINNTIDIDAGCALGGALMALRYPEMELVAVKAQRRYWKPSAKGK